MVVSLLLLFVVLAVFFMALSQKRAKLTDPVFRKAFILELSLYLALFVAVLVIAQELLGPYTSWVGPVFGLLAIPFVRMGYPNFFKFWRERST
jgi:hypothetical protein